MADSDASDAAVTSTNKRKKERAEDRKGSPRPIPCRTCVEKQLKYFKKNEWKNTCCEQRAKKGVAKNCYECFKSKRPCETFDEDDPAIKQWAAVQHEPEKYNDEEALNAACDMKLYILRTTDPISRLQKSLLASLESVKDSTATMIETAQDLATNYLSPISADAEGDHIMEPEHLPQQDTDLQAQMAVEDAAEKKEYPHLKDLDRDQRKQLIQLSKCRKLEDTLLMAQEIMTGASNEVRECLEDVRRKV